MNMEKTLARRAEISRVDSPGKVQVQALGCKSLRASKNPGLIDSISHGITGDTDACGGVGSQHQCRFGGLHSPVAGMAEPNSPANRPRAMRALWHQGGGRGGLERGGLEEDSSTLASTTADEESVVEGCLNGQAQGWQPSERVAEWRWHCM